MFLNLVIFIFAFVSYDIERPQLSRYTEYLSYSIPLTPEMSSSILLRNGDKYLIIYFLSPTAVGIYAVAYAICSLLGNFHSVLSPTLYPTISEAWDQGKNQQISELYTSILRWFVIFSIPATTGVIILAEPLLTLLSSADIATEGVFLVPLLAIAFLIEGVHKPLKFILTASENTNQIAVSVFFGAASNIALNIVFIQMYGLFGAGLSTVISSGLILGLMHFYASKKVSYSIPYDTLGRCLVATSGVAIILLTVPTSQRSIRLLIYPVLGALIYWTILIFIGEFNKSELVRGRSMAIRVLRRLL
jgi:O-antigen/teichoic acid export membrane protein